jgi:hypothetical protein
MRRAAMPDDPGRPRKPISRLTSMSTILGPAAGFIDETLRTFGLPLFWPYDSLEAAVEVVLNSSDAIYRGQNVCYGDGKPVVLVPGHLGGDVTLAPLSMWLHAIGYRPAKSNILINIDDRSLDKPLTVASRGAALRVGRKTIMIAFDTGLRSALRVAEVERDYVSDVIAVGLSDPMPAVPTGVRLHIIESARRESIVPHHEVNPCKGPAPCYALIRRRGGFLREFCGKYRSHCSIDLNPPMS